MDRSSTRLWILVLALAACSESGGSDPEPEPTGLVVQSISVPDFGSWQCNRPIEFAFAEPIDFASVSTLSIRIRTSAGVPANGTFAALAIDANGDGVPEGTDERVVVFYPTCPLSEDLSDAGLTPGARYLVTLAGTDTTQDPAALLRSVTGNTLARTVVLAFETIAEPTDTVHDEKPGAPIPLVRAVDASGGLGSYLEIGEDPGNRVFFEGDSSSGRTPSGFSAPLNLLGDPATHVAVVVVFDQPIQVAPANLARLQLEYESTPGVSGWRALETRAELLSNCRPGAPTVRLVPLGSLPPGGSVRVRIEAGFRDLLGQASPEPLEDFALAEVAQAAFTSLDPAGAVADELHEEFDFGPESPLSLADPARPLDAAPARWGEGELRASLELPAFPPELSEFDWVVGNGHVLVFDTTATSIAGGPDGEPTMFQHTTGGLVMVRNLVIESGGEIRVVGPNPIVLHASGDVSIRGVLDASGLDAADLPQNSSAVGAGAPGSAGGGTGGSGALGADARGGNGSGAFGVETGGGGGESGFAQVFNSRARLGGGGGGGRFASDQGLLVAESGGDGSGEATGADSHLHPPRGGAAGPEVFTDGDPTNDYFGVLPIVDGSGAVVARRRGELEGIHAGSGGGNGGDSILASQFPAPPGQASPREGGAGGGGGGAVVIRALGRIVFGADGRIVADGGSGGRALGGLQSVVGTSGGSGSGGHVILESARAIDFTAGDPSVPLQPWIRARGGPRVVQANVPLGFGGAGGPGVVQLHVPRPERRPDDPASNLILPDDALGANDPLGAVCTPRPYVLYPTIGASSRARSRWIPLGAAGEGGAAGPESVVAFLFDGVETAPGDDQGKVRTQGGRVPELAPLLGPLPLLEAELLSDGISLTLSGPALAPLRASAQPISPDVYLRTPALLEGFTLRLASVSEPDRRADLMIADARYDDATSRLTLSLGGLTGTLAEAVAELGGADATELALVPRFFRVRQGASGFDLLPDSRSVRILFQGAADDGTGNADELAPLVDWTADVTEFGRLAPGALDFVRFQVEFELDADGNGFDPEAEPLALDFLRLPLRW